MFGGTIGKSTQIYARNEAVGVKARVIFVGNVYLRSSQCATRMITEVACLEAGNFSGDLK